MANLFLIIMLGSFTLLVYGVFLPQKALFWQKDVNKRSRLNVLKYYSASIITSFIGFGVTHTPKKVDTVENKTVLSKSEPKTNDSVEHYLKEGIQVKEKVVSKVQRHLEETQKYSTDSMRIVLAKEYYMKGEKKLAIDELKNLMAKGNKEAETLWNIYNPILTKVNGYITRCCDGTTSTAKGRGACSHHQGVCNWNEPIIVQYREFE
jgi:hypothetical protein